MTDNDDLMVINKSGITIRIGVETLRVMGRATQGVKIIRLRDEDTIASVAKVSKSKEEELLDPEQEISELEDNNDPISEEIKGAQEIGEENSESTEDDNSDWKCTIEECKLPPLGGCSARNGNGNYVDATMNVKINPQP